MKKDYKVLYVATSRETMGGIASVLKRYETMPIWDKYSCAWLETQINKDIFQKLKYIVKAYLRMIFIVPRYNIVHFHTVPGRSVLVQLPVFLCALMWRRKIITHLHVGDQLKHFKNDLLFKYVLHKSSCILVLAKSINKMLLKHYSIISDVVYNPIDIPYPYTYSVNHKTIFFAAYLTRNKGYETLIRAFSSVVQKHPDWKLVIAGAGEVENARMLIKKYKIGGNTTVQAWCSREKMDELYAKTGIFCIASECEGLPMTFLESASRGIPLISTPVGGILDFEDALKEYCLFEYGDYEMLAARLNRLIESPDIRQKVSLTLRDFMQKYCSTNKVNDTLERIYNQIYQK